MLAHDIFLTKDLILLEREGKGGVALIHHMQILYYVYLLLFFFSKKFILAS